MSHANIQEVSRASFFFNRIFCKSSLSPPTPTVCGTVLVFLAFVLLNNHLVFLVRNPSDGIPGVYKYICVFFGMAAFFFLFFFPA